MTSNDDVPASEAPAPAPAGTEHLLAGKVAIVTGSGRGVGRAEALALAAAGAAVVVNDPGFGQHGPTSSPEPADEVVAEIRRLGGEAVANYESVADWKGAQRLVESAVEHFGGLDIVVNNAGTVKFQAIDEVTEEDFHWVVDVNLKGTFAVCVHAVPFLKRRGGGRIVNTCSGQWAAPTGNAPYATSKGGVVSLTWELALELREFGITVNAVAPFAATRLAADVRSPENEAITAGRISARRAKAREGRADPVMVAPTVVYLASEAASGVTGLVFRVGGGKIGLYQHPVESRSIFRDEATGPWPVAELIDLLPRTVLAAGSVAPHI